MPDTTVPVRTEMQRTLPRSAYTSVEVFERERERIFDRSWLYTGHASHLTERGDYVLVEACGESAIVVRGGERESVVASAPLRAFFNVCRHRGSRLCEAERGRFAGSISCPYHGWTYGLDGALVSARNMDGVEGFERSEFPLHAAQAGESEGLVFVNLAVGRDEPEPLSARALLEPLAEKLRRWSVAELGVAQTIAYDLACNWKLVFQNYSECYHCPLIHPQLDALSPWDSGANDLSEGAVLGGPMELRAEATTMSLDGESPRGLFPNLTAGDARRVYYYSVFPSLLLSLHPDYVMAHRVLPFAVDRTRIVCEWLFPKEVLGDPEFDPGGVVEFWDRTNRQDWHICELTQSGVSSRAYVPGPYSPFERVLPALDAWYRGKMA